MGDTFLWLGSGTTTDWDDPTNWRQFSGSGSSADALRIVHVIGAGTAATRAPGADDDVVLPPIVQPRITGGGAADTVVLEGDGLKKEFAGTGTEHYAFRELFVGEAGSNVALTNALLDVQSTFVPDFGFIDVSAGAVGTDGDGRPYTASLGALRLEATPGASGFGPGGVPLPSGGQLILGDRTVDVTSIFQGALGVGNSFDPDAGIVGTGAIHFPAAVTPAVPVVTAVPFFQNPQLIDHLDFGTIEVGETRTLSFTVTNFAGNAAQPLLGAVQTAVNGGHVTDPALTGSGVTPGNFFLPPDLTHQDFTVTLSGSTAHSLDDQAVHLAFYDGTGVTLPITGTVAEATGTPEPPPPSGEIDWDAVAALVQANFAATGQWFVPDTPPAPPAPPAEVDWNAIAAEVQAHFAATGQWF